MMRSTGGDGKHFASNAVAVTPSTMVSPKDTVPKVNAALKG